MAFTANTANITPDQTRVLDWPNPPTNWTADVKAIWEAAKVNPWVAYFEQSDVALLRATCSFHSQAFRNMTEPNAAIFKAVFDQYDRLLLSIRGRINSGLTINQQESVEVADEDIQILADSIKRRLTVTVEVEEDTDA